jgi:thioredoxin-like negative regulator of GroEL
LADNKQVHLAKINVDDNDSLAEKYEVSTQSEAIIAASVQSSQSSFFNQVSSIPAIYGVKNGKVINKFVGVKDNDELTAFIEELQIK